MKDLKKAAVTETPPKRTLKVLPQTRLITQTDNFGLNAGESES